MEIKEILIKPISFNKKVKKNTILLVDTYNVAENVSNKRHKNHSRFPHYIVKKDGSIIKTLNHWDTPQGFGVDNNHLIVALECLGELIGDTPVNIFGIPQVGTIHNRGWRNYNQFDAYTSEQIEALKFLCQKLLSELNIPKTVHENNFTVTEITYGIVYRSNLTKRYLDINPSFPFKIGRAHV
jgi:N-acetyl-anhydromuramyl-L-alanine amidase AmpD